MSTDKTRVPSPKVAAAKIVLNLLDPESQFPTTEELTALLNSRVSVKKRLQIEAAFLKMTVKLVDRCKHTVNRFENPNPQLVERGKALQSNLTKKKKAEAGPAPAAGDPDS